MNIAFIFIENPYNTEIHCYCDCYCATKWESLTTGEGFSIQHRERLFQGDSPMRSYTHTPEGLRAKIEKVKAAAARFKAEGKPWGRKPKQKFVDSSAK
jgi:hypothetical protein